jgi:acetyl/propionyl-CoA carboxylase alpha subunit
MFRIADGEELGYGDPELRGHSIEFRINGEDPGRGFLPAPGVVSTFRPPTGPGVRLDSGVEQGAVIGQNFDSLLAKLIVTGRTRTEALERSRRALAEFEIDGMPTALTFHRRGRGPGVRPGGSGRGVHRAHAVDRDRVRQHHRALRGPDRRGREGADASR